MTTKTSTTKLLPIPQATDFQQGYLSYKNDITKQYEEIKNLFRNRPYKASDTGVSYRNISHWENEGLLISDNDRGEGWRKFNLTEVSWIAVIAELRKIGVGLDKIKVLKEAISDNEKSGIELLEFGIVNAVIHKNDMIIAMDTEGKGALAHPCYR
jgi:DNA-binding transcriptional MerR regulator